MSILKTLTKTPGLHLLYSQFRTLEGLGIFKLILDKAGYTEFTISKTECNYESGKKMYALHTGTESQEIKEQIRNVYNGNWEFLPEAIQKDLIQKTNNNPNRNKHGEIIQLLMITASGSEGITLKNCRHVHILEPYWNDVRLEQVIGRARRICSHSDLEEKDRKIDVYIYIMVFDKKQNYEKETITTDEHLYQQSLKKKQISDSLLKVIQETAIDCQYNTDLNCVSADIQDPTLYSHHPDHNEKVTNVQTTGVAKFKELIYKKQKYLVKLIPNSSIYPIYTPTDKHTPIGEYNKATNKITWVQDVFQF